MLTDKDYISPKEYFFNSFSPSTKEELKKSPECNEIFNIALHYLQDHCLDRVQVREMIRDLRITISQCKPNKDLAKIESCLDFNEKELGL